MTKKKLAILQRQAAWRQAHPEESARRSASARGRRYDPVPTIPGWTRGCDGVYRRTIGGVERQIEPSGKKACYRIGNGEAMLADSLAEAIAACEEETLP